jgi:hypothetical protein
MAASRSAQQGGKRREAFTSLQQGGVRKTEQDDTN